MENKREREKIQTERELSEMKKESKVAKEEKDKIEKEYTGRFSKSNLRVSIRVTSRAKSLAQRRFNDLGFHGPPTPADQGPCGFDKGRSLTVKKIVKSLESLCVMELYRLKVGGFFGLVSLHMESPDL